MKRLISLFLILIFFGGCGEKTPDGIISRSEMIGLLTDLHVVEGYISAINQTQRTIPQNDLYKSIFAKHHTDTTAFNASMQYYTRNPEKFVAMYEEVQKNIDAIQKEVTDHQDESAKEPFRK